MFSEHHAPHSRVVFSFELLCGLDHCHIFFSCIAECVVVLFGEGDFLAEHRLLDLNTFDLVQLDFLLSRLVKFCLGFITLEESLSLFLIQPPDLVLVFAVFLNGVAVTSGLLRSLISIPCALQISLSTSHSLSRQRLLE